MRFRQAKKLHNEDQVFYRAKYRRKGSPSDPIAIVKSVAIEGKDVWIDLVVGNDLRTVHHSRIG